MENSGIILSPLSLPISKQLQGIPVEKHLWLRGSQKPLQGGGGMYKNWDKPHRAPTQKREERWGTQKLFTGGFPWSEMFVAIKHFGKKEK